MIRFPIAGACFLFKIRANVLMTMISRLVLTVIVVSLSTVTPFGQAKCLSPDQANAIPAQLNSSPNVAFNKKLHDELLKLAKGQCQKPDRQGGPVARPSPP